jgi:cell division transport system permease protein
MFKERHANDALIQESLAELNENPLEASLNVRASNTGQYGSIVSFLESHALRSSISTIDYYENEQVISRVQRISDSAQRGGVVALVVLSIIAVLVAFNTIRLTIYNQKQEIEIMRLVGGSNWYIRAPFIVEGSMYGIVAGFLALVVFSIGVHMVSPKLALLLSGVSLQAWLVGNLFGIIAITLVAGILLGVVSSVIAIHRFLKV